jgi:hypothetical protein
MGSRNASGSGWKRWGLGLCVLLPIGLGCVSSGAPTEPPDEVKKFIVDKVPEGEKLTELNVNFDDKITLIGASIDPGLDVPAGKRVKVTLYWRVEKALDDQEWKLFTHVLDGSGERLMNIDNVGPLRHIAHNRQAWAPGSWVPGKVYVDSQSFTMPRKVKTAKVQIVTGIWRGHDRLPIKSGPSISDNRALVATLTTSGGDKDKTQSPVPRLEVSQIKKGNRVRIDGKLGEDAWTTAASTQAFVNVSTGKPATESPVQGSAKLLWDDKALYIGVEVKEQNVVGGFDKAQKDPHLWTKDAVEIMIDPDGDGDNKDYYEIQFNPQNLVFDSQFDDYNKPRVEPNGPFGHEEWSAKAESAVRVKGTIDDSSDKDEGYVVEAKIPWSSFSKAKKAPPEPGSSWRMNIYAMKDNGGVGWSPILEQGNFHRASRFGRIDWVITPSAAVEKPVASKDEKAEKTEKAEAKAPAGKAAEPGAAPPAHAATEEPSDEKGLSVSRKALQEAPGGAPAKPPAE